MTIDVDPESSAFGTIIHRLPMPYKGDELHHSGEPLRRWRAAAQRETAGAAAAPRPRVMTTHRSRRSALPGAGWNACSSCFGDASKKRSNLILPTLHSTRVYAIDTATDPRAPKIAHILEPEEIKRKTGLTFLHTR